MIAIDITKFLKSFPQVRGPAVFMNALIFASLDKDIHFAFNPHYVGSQLYFYVVSAKNFKAFWDCQVPIHTSSSFKRKLWRFLIVTRNYLIELFPNLVKRFPFLVRKHAGYGRIHHPWATVAHHSSFKQMLSFFPSDSMWGLPMPETKKTLFLYDITFFEILRMIASPVNCDASAFIVQHIIDVNRALHEAHNLIVPTQYLAKQLPLHFPAAQNRPIDVVPLASTMVKDPNPLQFTPLRKSVKKHDVLVVCGFDGFKNDNKGMGAILDVIHLNKILFPGEPKAHFTLVTPRMTDLVMRIKELDIADCVTIKSCLPPEMLLEEYRQAKFLWVHSIDEGFCLPILEASLLEIPVLISDVPSLREIWGDSVDYIDVFNRYEAVTKFHSYYLDQKTAAKNANTIRANDYTIEKTAKGVWSVIEKVA